jgi:peptide/nickel transport system substrate-binding protein
MTNHAAYRDNAGAIGSYRPDKAKAALDAAGWKLAGSTREKDGRALTVNLVIPTPLQAAKQESELVQTMLKQVGVAVSIKPVPTADFFDKYISTGDFDMTIFSWIGTAFPVSTSESIYKKPVKDAEGELRIEQNYTRVGDDRIDGLFRQGNAELDKTRQQAVGNQIDVSLWDEATVLPMYQRPDLTAVKKGIVNFGAFAYASVVYADIGYRN